jgi:hypothetical protein
MTTLEFRNKIISIQSYIESINYDKNYFDANINKIPKARDGTKNIFCYYRRNANNKGRLIELTLQQFYILIKSCCFYCGDYPNTVTGKLTHNGVDRLNSNLGYTIGNVVPCCKRCNIAKSSMSVTEFKKHVELIYNSWARYI